SPTSIRRLADAGRPRGRRAWLALVAAAGLATGVVVYWRVRGHQAAPAAAGPRVIALLPFSDATKNPPLDFPPAGLPTLLGLELHNQPGVTVLGYYRLLGKVSGPEAPLDAWRAAARADGADVIVRGELTGTGDLVRVTIRVQATSGTDLD